MARRPRAAAVAGSELDDPGGALAAVLATAVRGQLHAAAGGEKVNELDFLHPLGSEQLAPAAKRALVRRLLDGGGAIDALTEAVCAGAESLVNAGASTGGELHETIIATPRRFTHSTELSGAGELHEFIAMGDDSVFKMSARLRRVLLQGARGAHVTAAATAGAALVTTLFPPRAGGSSGRRTRCWAR